MRAVERTGPVVLSRFGEVEVHATEGALLLVLGFGAISGIRLGTGEAAGAAALLILSLLVHEVGHLAMAQSLGVRVKAIGLCLKGAYLRRSMSNKPLFELLIASAGPAANLLLFAWFRDGNQLAHWVALLNLVLAVSNLLPIPHSDGSRIMSSWKELRHAKAIQE